MSVYRVPVKPKEVPGWGPQPIEDALRDLTREAFRVWIGLLEQPEEALRFGKKYFEVLFDVGRVRLSDALSELRAKGYIRVLQRPGRGQKNIIQIARPAIISQRRNFLTVPTGGSGCSHQSGIRLACRSDLAREDHHASASSEPTGRVGVARLRAANPRLRAARDAIDPLADVEEGEA